MAHTTQSAWSLDDAISIWFLLDLDTQLHSWGASIFRLQRSQRRRRRACMLNRWSVALTPPTPAKLSILSRLMNWYQMCLGTLFCVCWLVGQVCIAAAFTRKSNARRSSKSVGLTSIFSTLKCSASHGSKVFGALKLLYWRESLTCHRIMQWERMTSWPHATAESIHTKTTW